MRKKVLLVAPIGTDSAINGGYNKIANNLDYVLFKNEDKYKYSHCGCHISNFEKINEKFDVVLFQCHPNMFLNDRRFIDIFLRKKHLFKKCYLHIAWETENFPSKWVALNNFFDGYVTTSDFCKEEMSVLTLKPCYKFPFYVEDSFYEYGNKRITIEDKKDEKVFTLLFMGQNTKRKGLEEAVTAFSIFTQGKDDVRLICKYHTLSNKEIPAEMMIKSIVETNTYITRPNVSIIDYEIDENTLYEMYKDASLFVQSSRGEGFGLCGLEANLVGLPQIYTDFSAMKEVGEYCPEVNSAIDYTPSPAYGMSQYNYEAHSVYALPSIESIVTLMNYYYNNWKKDKITYYGKALEYTKNLPTFLNSMKNEFLEACFGE